MAAQSWPHRSWHILLCNTHALRTLRVLVPGTTVEVARAGPGQCINAHVTLPSALHMVRCEVWGDQFPGQQDVSLAQHDKLTPSGTGLQSRVTLDTATPTLTLMYGPPLTVTLQLSDSVSGDAATTPADRARRAQSTHLQALAPGYSVQRAADGTYPDTRIVVLRDAATSMCFPLVAGAYIVGAHSRYQAVVTRHGTRVHVTAGVSRENVPLQLSTVTPQALQYQFTAP